MLSRFDGYPRTYNPLHQVHSQQMSSKLLLTTVYSDDAAEEDVHIPNIQKSSSLIDLVLLQ